MSSYDHTLLDEAPRATRAQRQEGYNVDLLEQPPRRRSSVRSLPQLPVPFTQTGAEAGSGEKLGSALYTSTAPTPRTSFWRSRKGVITAVVIALIVIGAVVGGAVGGTTKKSSNDSVTTGGIQPASSPNPSAPFNSDGRSTSTSNSLSEPTTATVAGSTSISSTGPTVAAESTSTSFLTLASGSASALTAADTIHTEFVPTATQTTGSQNIQRIGTATSHYVPL